MINIDDMVKSGMHYGHSTREWNPRMAPFIYREKNGRHILDLVQTQIHLYKVVKFLEENSTRGKTFLFVGTNKKVAPLICKTALACNSYYVNQRWLGGMLTNWKTVRKSIKKLIELRQAEENGDWKFLKKQEVAGLKREQQRLEKYLGGLENMAALPDVVIIVGQSDEIHAVRECRELGIPTVTLLDTNCDPSLADWAVPANDDSVSALRLLLGTFQKAIITGHQRYKETQQHVQFKGNKQPQKRNMDGVKRTTKNRPTF